MSWKQIHGEKFEIPGKARNLERILKGRPWHLVPKIQYSRKQQPPRTRWKPVRSDLLKKNQRSSFRPAFDMRSGDTEGKSTGDLRCKVPRRNVCRTCLPAISTIASTESTTRPGNEQCGRRCCMFTWCAW